MFADFLSDSDWSNHSHRGWTTLISFALQALAVGCLLLLPLLYTDGLPRLAMLAPLLAPAPPPGGSATAARAKLFRRTCPKQPDGKQTDQSSADSADCDDA